jgi:hypothetical protein
MSSPTQAQWKASVKCESFKLTFSKKDKKGSLYFIQATHLIHGLGSVDPQSWLLLFDNAPKLRSFGTG